MYLRDKKKKREEQRKGYFIVPSIEWINIMANHNNNNNNNNNDNNNDNNTTLILSSSLSYSYCHYPHQQNKIRSYDLSHSNDSRNHIINI